MASTSVVKTVEVTVKQLSTKTEHKFQVDPNAPCSVLFNEVQQLFQLQSGAQIKLTVGGKVLNGAHTLREQNISDGCKMHLLVTKPSTVGGVSVNGSTTVETSNGPNQSAKSTTRVSSVLRQELRVFLRPHFTEQDCKAIIDAVGEKTNECIMQISLDDIERVATARLHPNV